ncbi:MAG: hypothetical protein KAS86_04050 [Candidatus Omnitrophica bacterium]|nr:hypothetical protein [Candidatus Omnitrophota bacterium]
MMKKHFNTHKLRLKAMTISMICLFMLNNISFASQPGALQRSVHSLAPFSRFSSIEFMEDAGLIYLNRLIGRVLDQFGSKISADGLKRFIEKHLSSVDITRFDPEGLYREGDTFCLPCTGGDSGQKLILRYYLPHDNPAEAAGKVSVSVGIGEVMLICEYQEGPGESPEERTASLPESVERFDRRPVNVGLLQEHYVKHDMAVKRAINPGDKPLTGVYGAAGADVSNFFLSTNAAEAYFISQYSDVFFAFSRRDLKKCFNRDPEEYIDKHLSKDYCAWKFFRGFAGGHAVEGKNKMVAALAFELKVMGVDLNTVKISSYRGCPRITFQWGYSGAAEKERSITLVNADVTRPDEYKHVLEGKKIDIYYQRAANETAYDYRKGRESFIGFIYTLLNPGGFFVTDDHVYDYMKEWYCDLGPEFPLEVRETEIPGLKGIEADILKRRGDDQLAMFDDNQDYYGWKVRIRQKPFITVAAEELNGYSGTNKRPAQDLIDIVIMQAYEAKKRDENVIIGIDTSWIPATQIAAIQGLLSRLNNLSRGKGLGNITIKRSSGEALAGVLAKEIGKKKTSLSNVVILGDRKVLGSKAFDAFREPDAEKEAAFFAEIALPEDFPENSYIRLLDMLTIALKLAFGEPVSPEHPFMDIVRGGRRTFRFIPRAEPFEFEELRNLYEIQRQAIAAAA